MADMKQIHDFAVKWCYKFRDPNINYIELVDHWMADDCAALGFEMDCGHAFFEKYGNAAGNYAGLDKIIEDVDDIPLLGSMIYSQWRYFNHWAYTGKDILKPENRMWFILALSRLAMLSGDNPFIFRGTLRKMRIVSKNICYGLMPRPDEEVEQHLTVNDEGCVCFSGYNYRSTSEKCKKVRSRNFKIEKASADKLLNTIAACFGNEYTGIFATDVGNWVMELTNTDGVTYKFCGALCTDYNYGGTHLSNLVRDAVGMDDLFVLDGHNSTDVIRRITLDYYRVTTKQAPEDKACECVTYDCSERLIVDRELEVLEHIINTGTGCRISQKYEVGSGIESLFKKFDDELFANVEGDPEDAVETPDEIKDYKITIDYQRRSQRVIAGTYDRNNLPKNFDDFAKSVMWLIRNYSYSEMLDPSVYGKARRRRSEYIYCSVIFDEIGYKSYYYLTDDDSIEIGDFVLVPAGKDNREVIVQVVDIEYFSEEKVPLSLEKTKRIIRKCTDDDFDIFD